MKKYKLSYTLAVIFTFGFIISFACFDGESAGGLLLFAAIATISGIINFKLDK